MSESLPTDNLHEIIKTRHSSYETRTPNGSVPSKSATFSRSEVDIIRTRDFPSIIDSGCVNRLGLEIEKRNSEEYYKTYEHDDVPVKEFSNYECYSDDAATGDRKELTNSDLDKLEIRIYNNISKELQTDESSGNGLENNIQLFKTTVQAIFDNFNTNMRDFEIFKEKFQNILSKTKENTVDEMEEFIKNMIQHIISKESCTARASNESNLLSFSEIETGDSKVNNEVDSITFSRDITNHPSNTTETTIEAYKNENYLTDSTFDKGSSKMVRSENQDRNYNIYLATGYSGVGTKIDGRNVLSQINFRNAQFEEPDHIASAENIKRIAAKKTQLKKYVEPRVERQTNDIVIPLKVSYAKKNIHSEDVADGTEDSNQFFLFKICNYLCRKFRKNSFG